MPYFISRIEDSSGKVVFEAEPKLACLRMREAGAGSRCCARSRLRPACRNCERA